MASAMSGRWTPARRQGLIVFIAGSGLAAESNETTLFPSRITLSPTVYWETMRWMHAEDLVERVVPVRCDEHARALWQLSDAGIAEALTMYPEAKWIVRI